MCIQVTQHFAAGGAPRRRVGAGCAVSEMGGLERNWGYIEVEVVYVVSVSLSFLSFLDDL